MSSHCNDAISSSLGLSEGADKKTPQLRYVFWQLVHESKIDGGIHLFQSVTEIE